MQQTLEIKKCASCSVSENEVKSPFRGAYCNPCGVRIMRHRHTIGEKTMMLSKTEIPFIAIEEHDSFVNSRSRLENIEELMASIEESGLLEEPIVWRIPTPPTTMPWGEVEERFFLIAGFRRVAAIGRIRKASKKKELPFSTIPVKVFEGDLQGAMRLNLTENLQRENLTIFDIAMYCRRMIEDTGISRAELARQIGKAESWLSMTLHFVKDGSRAVQDLKDLARDGVIGFWLAQKIAEKDPAEQLKICARLKSAERLSKMEGSDEEDPLKEEVKKIKAETAAATKKVRSKKEIATKLAEWRSIDFRSMKEKDKFHAYGVIKALEWALGEDVSWEDELPTDKTEEGPTFVQE